MAQYEIKPFELTADFENCWLAAGRHLNLRVKDAGARWLRAQLPPFREHLSFALGNQLIFVQVFDVNESENGWLQMSRLQAAVADGNGIGCLMPMKRSGEDWSPVEKGWGLINMQTHAPINPVDLTTDLPIEMTPWEIHDFGIQKVVGYLGSQGWKIASWQSDLGVDPSIFAQKDGIFCGFVVRTSNRGPGNGDRPQNAVDIAQMIHSRGWGAKFVGLKVADCNSPTHLDPRLQHLTRRIFRGAEIICSKVEVEELVPVGH